jgi:hypothetical protein
VLPLSKSIRTADADDMSSDVIVAADAVPHMPNSRIAAAMSGNIFLERVCLT